MRALQSREALQRAIEELPASAAVLDGTGTIIAVNEPWRRFARENGLRDGSAGVGTSYLRACQAPGARSTEGPAVAGAIRRALDGRSAPFRKVYSCHGPDRAAWFQVEVASLHHHGWPGALVTHVGIDEAVFRRELANEERRHIARELHDTTAQNLTAALLELEQIARTQRETRGTVSGELRDAMALCQRSLEEVRSLAYEIAPAGFRPGRLVDSLKRLATTFARRTGFAVMLLAAPITIDDDDLSRESSEAIYRAAAESLNNVRRHSGGHSVSLSLHQSEEGVRLEVRDDGHGMAPDAEPGKGLSDVRERLEACGGRLEIPPASRGMALVAIVPAGGEGNAFDRNRR